MGNTFCGLDLAKRIDHSALIILTLDNGVLYHTASKVWSGVPYQKVADDMDRYNKEFKFYRVGFDRTGVGDAAIELFKNKNLYEPIVMTNNTKTELINLVDSLFQNDKLKIKQGSELEKQISEQTWDRTTAGNLIYRHPTSKHDDLFWALCYACSVASPYLAGITKPIMGYSEPVNYNLEESIEYDLEEMMNTV